ncbi:hypothetical protein AX16_006572 [Volvariella volvacea WC 439]|nr:hypothetical protein AX16_006572 [Volvariella volvacea WC 439]
MNDPNRDLETGLNNPRPRPRSSIPSFLFLTAVLFLLTSHSGDEFLARHQHQEALDALTWQLSNFTAWMNGTAINYTVPEQDPAIPPLLNAFGLIGNEQDPLQASYYTNLTGFIRGKTEMHNITSDAIASRNDLPWKNLIDDLGVESNMTAVEERLGAWNWTASQKISFSVVEKRQAVKSSLMNTSDDTVLLHGRMEFENINTSDEFRYHFEGVHFLKNGSIYGLVKPPDQHIDLRLLPSLVPLSGRNDTAGLIEPELNARITKLKNLIDAGVLDQDTSNDDEPPESSCTFSLYGQIEPVNIPGGLMIDLERELQNPTGAWTVSPPKLRLTGILVSQDCGMILQIKESEGIGSRSFFRKVTTYAAMAGLAYLALFILFTRQAHISRTASGISRVSRWTFVSQLAVDSVSFAGHITFSILAEGRTSLSLVAPAFLSCALFFYQVQFVALISAIQLPEDTVPAAPAPTPTATNNSGGPSPPAASATPTTTGANANPTTTNNATTTPNSPTSIANTPTRQGFFSFFIQHVQTDPQARLWVMLFIFLTFVVRVILSPTLSMLFVAITYSNIWLPQIVRSVKKGRSSGLTKEFILGTTFFRLALALYFLTCPKNVIDIEPRSWAYLLALFVICQALLLIAQDTFGPAFFLPRRYAVSKTYDYHPPMSLPDPEAPEPSLGDCVICLEPILVDGHRRRSKSIDEKGGWDISSSGHGSARKTAGGLLSAVQIGVEQATARKNYSLAPCHHLFHTECLERWLSIKNICPQCRRPLPPL